MATTAPHTPAAHSYVFKLKYASPSGKEETRRYGFVGDLRQEAVFEGLYERTAQVFNLARADFHLVFHDALGRAFRLSTYADYSDEVCDPTLDPEALAASKRDEKNRIVLIFHIRRDDPAQNATDVPDEVKPEVAVEDPILEQQTFVAYAEVPSPWEREIEAGLNAPEAERPPPSSTLFTPAPTPEAATEVDATAALSQPFAFPYTAPHSHSHSHHHHHPSRREHPYHPHRHHHGMFGAPPAPPQLPLSALPPPPPLARATRGPLPVAPSLIDVGPVVAARREDLERRCREFQERKRALQAQAFARFHPAAGPSTAVPTPAMAAAIKGYAPSYSSPVPVNSSEPIDVDASSEAPEPADSWSGVKTLLKTFVKDLNRHLADNFGDVASDFELSLPSSPVTETAPEHVVEEAALHKGVFCDACVKTIVGTRWKCSGCSNYDLCDSCITNKASHHPAAHDFGRIARPGDVPIFRYAETTEKKPDAIKAEEQVVHAATCDLCDKAIKGVRHKCFQCPDFDCCESCFTDVAHLHPHHNFVPIASPKLFTSKLQPGDNVVHARISCDGCGAHPITGVRWKCAHPDCPDFDMCANCEADPIARHPRSHPLLKLREPVANVIVGHYVEDKWKGQTQSDEPASSSASVKKGKEVATESHEEMTPEPTLSTFERIVAGHRAAAENFAKLVASTAEKATGMESAKSVVVEEKAEELDSAVEPVEEAKPEVTAEEVQQPLVEYGATFVSDVTLADKSVVPAGGLFQKIWQVKNTGLLDWPAGTHLINVGGFSKTSIYDIKVQDVPMAHVGESVEIEVELKAPETDGRTMDHWRLATADGVAFGDRFWVDITVESDEEALRQSGSLSASMVAPSINAAGKTAASTAPTDAVSLVLSDDSQNLPVMVATDVDESDSEEEEEEEEEEESSSEEESELEDSDQDSDADSFVVLSGSEPSDSDDEEWNNAPTA